MDTTSITNITGNLTAGISNNSALQDTAKAFIASVNPNPFWGLFIILFILILVFSMDKSKNKLISTAIYAFIATVASWAIMAFFLK